MTRNHIMSVIIAILFVGLIRFRPIWERNFDGFWNTLFFLSVAILFLWLIFKIVTDIFRLVNQRKSLFVKEFIPILVMSILLLDGMFNPMKINIDKIYGQVDFRACYEGTQNQAILKLRKNGNFDIHWTGVFFYNNFYTGNYVKSGDTVLLNFDTEIPRNLNDTMIVKGEYLYRIQADTLISTQFYLGYCKGLN